MLATCEERVRKTANALRLSSFSQSKQCPVLASPRGQRSEGSEEERADSSHPWTSCGDLETGLRQSLELSQREGFSEGVAGMVADLEPTVQTVEQGAGQELRLGVVQREDTKTRSTVVMILQ